MTAHVKVLMMFVNETDTWEGVPLYQALVSRLLHLGLSGATAHIGALGFGHHIRAGHKGGFRISDDRPVTITVIDRDAILRAAVPELRQMARQALILLLDAEVLAD